MSSDKMPPLPEPPEVLFGVCFTADQMHAYARAYAAEQTRELVGALERIAAAAKCTWSNAEWIEAHARAAIAKATGGAA